MRKGLGWEPRKQTHSMKRREHAGTGLPESPFSELLIIKYKKEMKVFSLAYLSFM